MLQLKNGQKKLNSKTYQTLIPAYIWRSVGIIQPIPEFRFTLERRWRIDYAWPEVKVAVEIEGGIYLPKCRHTTPKGFKEDIKKYNKMVEMNWLLLRYIPQEIDYSQIKKVIDFRISLQRID